MALIARRAMQLNGQPIKPGQAVDGLWPALRERTRRALLSTRRVVENQGDVIPVAPATVPPKRKRGRTRKEVVHGEG